MDVPALARRLATLPGVAGVHDLHAWPLAAARPPGRSARFRSSRRPCAGTAMPGEAASPGPRDGRLPGPCESDRGCREAPVAPE